MAHDKKYERTAADQQAEIDAEANWRHGNWHLERTRRSADAGHRVGEFSLRLHAETTLGEIEDFLNDQAETGGVSGGEDSPSE